MANELTKEQIAAQKLVADQLAAAPAELQKAFDDMQSHIELLVDANANFEKQVADLSAAKTQAEADLAKAKADLSVANATIEVLETQLQNAGSSVKVEAIQKAEPKPVVDLPSFEVKEFPGKKYKLAHANVNVADFGLTTAEDALENAELLSVLVSLYADDKGNIALKDGAVKQVVD